MSHLTEIAISGKFVDRGVLAAALRSIHLTPHAYDTPQILEDYNRSGQHSAEIVLKRQELDFPSYSDIGFKRNPDTGEYDLVADDQCIAATRKRLEGLESAYREETRKEAEARVRATIAEMEKTKGEATVTEVPLADGGRRLVVTFANENIASSRR